MNNIDQLLQLACSYEMRCKQSLVKTARIKGLSGTKYHFIFEDKNEDNEESKEKIIDLTKAVDFSYSAIMREIRQKASKDQVREFLILFKKEFDNAIKRKLQKPDRVALQNSLTKFNKKYPIKLAKKLVKNAAVSELGDPVIVGKYLSDIVRFTLFRLPIDKRSRAIDNLRRKFYSLNADEIGQKKLPPTASIGQSITFVKHVLFNHNPKYIREVLNSLVRNLS